MRGSDGRTPCCMRRQAEEFNHVEQFDPEEKERQEIKVTQSDDRRGAITLTDAVCWRGCGVGTSWKGDAAWWRPEPAPSPRAPRWGDPTGLPAASGGWPPTPTAGTPWRSGPSPRPAESPPGPPGDRREGTLDMTGQLAMSWRAKLFVFPKIKAMSRQLVQPLIVAVATEKKNWNMCMWVQVEDRWIVSFLSWGFLLCAFLHYIICLY